MPRSLMTRRQLLESAGVAAAATVAAPMINRGRYALFGSTSQQYSARCLALMERSIAIDMLALLTLDFEKGTGWFANPDAYTAADYRDFQDSGLSVIHPAVGTGGPNAYDGTLRFIASWNSFLAGRSDMFLRIDAARDLDHIKASGKVGVILGVQNAEHFRTVDDVDFFYGLGQRVAQLTYNSRTRIGNGSTERVDGGLSDYGVAVVERMNELGMAVDVSHCGDQTTLDAFASSSVPVLITHSNCRALVPGHPRCKTDEAIRAMADRDGVMGITGVRMFVRDREPTTVEHLLDHFDHVARLVGVEHLGVGSDIDLHGYDDMPAEANQRLRAGYKGSYGFRDKIDIEGVDHPKRMYDLTEGLIRRGYTDPDIEGILGGNFKRVLGQIWKT